MKLIYVAVFTHQSTNYAQSDGFKKIGCEVIEYSYRDRSTILGTQKRDDELIELIKTEKPDLVVFAKCPCIDIRVIHECNKICKTCLWFMDAFVPGHWNSILIDKIKYCSFNCCDKTRAVEEGLKYNKNTYYVCEGYDHLADKPFDLIQDINISFIGGIYGNRSSLIPPNCQVFSNSYGEDHAKIVSRSKINLNFCTGGCASDRVYKILAAKGFLITDDWIGRTLEDKKDLVIFRGQNDLIHKINYYINNEEERNIIRENGYNSIQKYSRIEWARNIIDIYNRLEK